MRSESIQISLIVPVYNDPQNLFECVSALRAAALPGSEIIVVDDGSTDETASVAAGLGVHVLYLKDNGGPGRARNYGARHARGDVFVFIDADVLIAPGLLPRVVEFLIEHREVAAIFGSYDARPRAKGVVSQYRNLLHHFVHQNAEPEASTFWAGCGAIRRCAFESVGGFDEHHSRQTIEDIELGYRLTRAANLLKGTVSYARQTTSHSKLRHPEVDFDNLKPSGR